MRLDKVLGKWANWGKNEARLRIASGEVFVNEIPAHDGQQQIGTFDQVRYREEMVQSRLARYLILHKPLGVVSATKDDLHQTAVDLVQEDWASELHLAGRLDRFTSGLLILTNDSAFSESVTIPAQKVGKRYRVTIDREVSPEMVQAFQKGIRFEKERVVTAPAIVTILAKKECLLTIYEGKHHQVKRMFARFDAKVTALHREAIGELELPLELEAGEWRSLTESEQKALRVSS